MNNGKPRTVEVQMDFLQTTYEVFIQRTKKHRQFNKETNMEKIFYKK